jgi:hypothetical protein
MGWPRATSLNQIALASRPQTGDLQLINSLCQLPSQPVLSTAIRPGKNGFGFVTGTSTPVMK